jgi:hypothetical protein
VEFFATLSPSEAMVSMAIRAQQEARSLLRSLLIVLDIKNNAATRLFVKGITNGKSRLALLLCASFVLLGCSGGKDKKAAAEAINKGLQKEGVALFLHLGRVGAPCGDEPAFVNTPDLTAQTLYYSAKKAGLIAITPDGPGFWKIDLIDGKPAVVEALKHADHNKNNGCDNVSFIFLVARKSVAELTNLHDISGEKAEAEFTWKWELRPAGEKLLNALSEQERIQLNANLENTNRRQKPDPTFSLAHMTESTTPRPAKTALKRSGEGWVLDE